MHLTINTDGGGQPGTDVGGPVAAAYVVSMEGMYLGSQSRKLVGTNNIGEYTGVLIAVEALRDNVFANKEDIESVTFIADSQLVVYQLSGKYKCHNAELRVFRDKILKIVSTLPFPVEFTWDRREKNMAADQVCTHTMVHGDKTDFHAPIPERPTKKEISQSRTLVVERVNIGEPEAF